MTYELIRELAVSALRSAMEAAELQTDAGTVDPYAFDPGPDADEAMERAREREDAE